MTRSARPLRSPRRGQRGFASVLALVFLVVFSALAVAFVTFSRFNLQLSRNHNAALQAQTATESGMAYATKVMQGVRSEGYLTGHPDMMQLVYDHLSAKLDGGGCLGGQQVAYDTSDPNHPVITVPSIALPDGRTFHFTVAVAQADAEGVPTQLRLTVNGSFGQYSRTAAVNYDIVQDTTILTYSIASRVRMIVTAHTLTDPDTGEPLPTVDGDICSSWTHTHLGWYDVPPVTVEEGSVINGKIKTVLSEEEFNEYDSGEAIEGEHQGIAYDEPPFPEYEAADFDTSAYRAQATNSLPATPDDYWTGWFPSDADRQRYFENVPVYQNRNFTNVKVPTGTNPVFIKCTFNEITYVDTDETKTLDDWSYSSVGQNTRSWHKDRPNALSNNVSFMGCAFNGPVITGVPKEFWWTKNALNFADSPDGTAHTVFSNTHMSESTILAPNFNVNIGDFHDPDSTSRSTLTGIIVGGIVDVRDYAEIHGTILSMANLDIDSLGSTAQYYATNIGSYAGDPEVPDQCNPPAYIHIKPQKDNPLPYGIKVKYTVKVNPDSYVEVSP